MGGERWRLGSGKLNLVTACPRSRLSSCRHAGEGFDAGLGLAGFGGFGAEAVNEGLHVGAFGGDFFDRTVLLHGAFGADADEFVEAAGG